MRAKAKPLSAAGPPTVKLSVNVAGELGAHLRRIAFDERISESSIVEIALDLLFTRANDASIGAFLRDRGATLRRPDR